jgi:hypothetical protein
MTIDKSYYYFAKEWSRSIGYGEVPTDRSQPMIQLELFPKETISPNSWIDIKSNIE